MVSKARPRMYPRQRRRVVQPVVEAPGTTAVDKAEIAGVGLPGGVQPQPVCSLVSDMGMVDRCPAAAQGCVLEKARGRRVWGEAFAVGHAGHALSMQHVRMRRPCGASACAVHAARLHAYAPILRLYVSDRQLAWSNCMGAAAWHASRAAARRSQAHDTHCCTVVGVETPCP
eukprot:162452-Chlamydomonas_euryale.AAC.3